MRELGLLTAACVALAALSLLLPSTPSYDPWAWIEWGREIVHLDLDTRTGPSWKPLPVLFTTLFAPFGDAAPFLWLVVARAGGLLALAMAFRVAKRLVGGPAGWAAGLVAAVALASSSDFLRTQALGYSEGLLVALILMGVERHLRGRADHALAFGFVAALLRPETWPFLGAYGLWVWLRRPQHRRLAVGLAVALPALWFLPELWGSGDPFRASARAQGAVGDSPALAEDPAGELLRRARWVLIAPIETGILLATAFALVGWVRQRRDAAVLVIGAAAATWIGLVAVMTERGYAGNERYLIAPMAIGCVLAGFGWGRAGAALAALLARVRPSPGRRTAFALPVAATLALALVAVAAAMPATRARGDQLDRDIRGLGYQAELRRDLDAAIDRAGGGARLRACGPAATGDYQVPMLAWHLGVPAKTIELGPGTSGAVFRARATPTSRPAPPAPASEYGFHSIARAGEWSVIARCPAGR